MGCLKNTIKNPSNNSDPNINDCNETKLTQGTTSACDFFISTQRLIELFNLIIDTILHSDYMAYVAKETLDRIDSGDPNDVFEEINSGDLAVESPGNRTKILRRHRQMLIEMFLSKQVDIFLTYFSNIVREILLVKPDLLKSNQQKISLNYVLQFEDMSELVEDLVEKKIIDLSYGGFIELENWFEKRMGVKLDVKNTDQLIEVLETRNIIVHNKCIINKKYNSKVLDHIYNIGDMRVLDVNYLFNSSKLMVNLITRIDTIMLNKFHLHSFDLNKYFQEKTENR